MIAELIDNITNIKVFTDSLEFVKNNFSISNIFVYIMAFFSVVGAIDKIRGNKKGYGEKFEEGFMSMGPLAISMVGIVALSPVLKVILQPIITPIFSFFGASPAMFAGTFFIVDAGAYPLALEMAEGDLAIANFSGIVLGSMLGIAIVGIMPLALTLLDKKDMPYLSTGVLIALITIPLGALIGGIVMNYTAYDISIVKILINLLPVVIISILIALGMWFKPQSFMRGFSIFGNIMVKLIAFGAGFAIFQYLTGIRFPLLSLMVEPSEPGGTPPLLQGIYAVGEIGLVLTGTFPFIEWLTKTFKKPIQSLGKKLGMNETGSAGILVTTSSIIPMFVMFKDMNDKGKLLNIAFGISAAWVLGDHLAFTAGVEPGMILPLVISKFIAGFSAMFLAYKLSPILLRRIKEAEGEYSNEQSEG